MKVRIETSDRRLSGEERAEGEAPGCVMYVWMTSGEESLSAKRSQI